MPPQCVTVCRGQPRALVFDGRALSELEHSSTLLPWKKVTCARDPVCTRACMQKLTRRDGVVLVCPDQHVTPATKMDQCIQKARTKNAHAQYFVLDTLLAGLAKSARMHKHANETRACAVGSDARSQLHVPTDAAASAFPASRQALQAPQRRRRQHTDLNNTNTLDKEDKARAQCEAPCYCVQCEHHVS